MKKIQTPLRDVVDDMVSLFIYEGEARKTVIDIKYKNDRRHLNALAYNLAARLSDLVDQNSLITWLPTTTAHVNERGFDHAQLLCLAVARYLRCQSLRVFVSRKGLPQTKKSRDDRLRGVRFVIDKPARVYNRHIVLIDDVVTTGSTAAAGARILRAAGASRVSVAVVAATPRYIST